ncbi:MAG: DPP IV N-terminal domain-containing protein, partial [Planctomycetota bacterium]
MSQSCSRNARLVVLFAGLTIAGCASTPFTRVHGEPTPTPAPTQSSEAGSDASELGELTHASDAWALGTNDTHASIRLAANDGRTPAYDVYADSIMGSFATSGEHAIGLESVNISQVTMTDVGSDFDPDVAPDGQFIAFASTRHNPNADVYIKGVGRNVLTQLTQDPGHDVMPSISPDNRRIAFASNRHGSWDIFVVDRDGGRPVRVTDHGSHELHPSWSPNGSRLVFSRLGQSSGRWELWVVEPNDPAKAHFVGYGLFPEWCPIAGTGVGGADKILFQRSRERGERAFGVWTIDFSGDQAHRPTMLASSAQHALINPTWSP